MHEKLAVVTALALGLNMASAADAPRFGQPITPSLLLANFACATFWPLTCRRDRTA
jgi:hypothetical protein